MSHPRLVAALLAATILLPVIAVADGDEPPLYLRDDGRDAGNCLSDVDACQSLSYALQRVGKNGQILVGPGRYVLTDMADLTYVLSGAIDVRAVTTGADKPTLVGVAPEFAAELQAKGFHVITDTKGLNAAQVERQLALRSNTAATVCSGGFADGFPCDSVDLLSHVADRTPSARGADIWGFIDLNTFREYAIIAYSTGTAVFDVTDAENPREVNFISGQRTTWRDIKVHQFWNAAEGRWNAYAYITADSSSEGLFILDLNQLPHRADRVAYGSDFSSAHNIFLTDTDFATGLSITGAVPNLILAGSNIADGRFRLYLVTDPRAPNFATMPGTPANQPANNRLYMHDAASMVVTDARKNSQCVNAGASDHCDILFDFNESSVDIWDITLPASATRLSSVPYGNARYTHSGWPTEDQQFVFIQDELDERDAALNTTLRVLDLSDLTAPVVMTAWTGPTRAIDHNGFVRGNRYYMSNYARGLSVLDITDPTAATLVGRFDTYPVSDGSGFPGNWGTYPFLPSGNIALSDIDSGLYMVADRTLDVAEGTFTFSTDSFASDESGALQLTVNRVGGSSGAASVRWEWLGATADTSDVDSTSGVLNWADGDSGSKTISINASSDVAAEGLELGLVRLLAPTGGATISAPAMASVYISDVGATSSIAFSSTAVTTAERGFALAVVTVARSGSALGPVTVDYSVVSGDAVAGADFTGASNGTISWADGDARPKNIEFEITDDGSNEPNEFFELQLANATGGSLGTDSTARVTILDGNGDNSVPNAIAGASQNASGGATVNLDGTGSNDPDGDTLAFAWTQIQGPTVTLSDANIAQPSFTAPTPTSDTLLRFQLQVTDTTGLSDTSIVNVTITGSGSGGGGGGLAGGNSGGGGPTGILFVLVLLGAAAARVSASRTDGS